VTAGQADLFGVRRDGWQVEHEAVFDEAPMAAPTLALDVEVGFGDLEVSR
jgi:hypothetical protein